MAHLLANNPGHQDAGEILLSGFTQMALHMEAQRRLMKPGSKPRRGKKGQKKQPQRGLGVAQLEKIRLEEQRRASQHVQQLAALRQLHGGAPLHAAHLNAPTTMPTMSSIVPQFQRENNHLVQAASPATTSSGVARAAAIDSIANSFLFKNVTPPSSIAHPSTPATTPLDLFPQEKFAVTSSYMRPSDRIWMDKNPYRQHLIPDDEGRASLVESPQSLLALTCNQRSVQGQDDSGPNYPFLQLRRKSTSILDLWHPSQVPGRVVTPSFSLERMMELSSFQSTMSSRDDQHLTLKRRASGVVQQLGGQFSELPTWMTPACAHSKGSQEYASHGRNNMDVCELTLRPPGEIVPPIGVNAGCQQPERALERNCFLSLSVGACSWQDSSAAESTPCSSSTPSPVSATTTCKSSANEALTTDEYMSSPITGCSSLPSFFSMMDMDSSHPKKQESLFSSFDASLDLTLKL